VKPSHAGKRNAIGDELQLTSVLPKQRLGANGLTSEWCHLNDKTRNNFADLHGQIRKTLLYISPEIEQVTNFTRPLMRFFMLARFRLSG
jgi:hypothetical protein